ncbi:MAG: MFS transporter [Chloroflexi bacterium]|nr:MFS transporter [Chloroflexota bacterium]
MVVVAGVANASRVSSAVEVSSVFVPALVAEFGWSRTLIASATTLGGVATALSGPIVGRILDRYGGRIVVPLGALAVGAGCIALASVQTAAVFVVVYALVRMAGQSFMQFPNQVTVAKWFERRRGTATALLVGIGSVGLIVAPVAVQAIIGRAGIGAAWIALGVLALSLGVLPTLLLSARRPEDLGLRPDGAEREAAVAEAEPSGDGDPAADWTVREALRTRALYLLLGSTVFFSLASTGVGFHQLSYYLERGISPGTAAAAVSSFAFGLMVGGIMWGWLADRLRVQLLLTVEYAMAAVLMLLLLGVRTPVQALPISFGFGMLVGGALAMPTLLLAAYYGRRYLGSIAGILQMARGLALGSGPLVAGIIYDLNGSYAPAFTAFSVMCVGAVVMMAFVRRPVRG